MLDIISVVIFTLKRLILYTY